MIAVYNWTVDDVILWLVSEVELPQYADTFRVNAVDGRVLPRSVLTILATCYFCYSNSVNNMTDEMAL